MITNYPSISHFKQLVELKDYRKATKKDYVGCVSRLARHFLCDPAMLTQDKIRQYFLFLRQEKHCSASAMKVAKYALRCFFVEQLKVKDWTLFEDLRIAQPQTLPVVLSRAEVQALLGAVLEPRFATCLRLIYHCGLRIGEAVNLKVTAIHGRQNPPYLHIRDAKGGKDRYVPIAPAMVAELRQWWLTHRHPTLLFPSPKDSRSDASALLGPPSWMSQRSVQLAYSLARQAAKVNSASTPHTLRHSYATHLLEAGVSLRQISQYLGHKSMDTTVIYTHLTTVSEAHTQAVLAKLYRPLKA